METTRIKPRYDVQRMSDDMSRKGWMMTDLAREAGVSNMTVTRFFRSEAQTAKTARKLSFALGRKAGHYLIPSASPDVQPQSVDAR